MRGPVALISFAQFGRLRLKRFLPAKLEIVEHGGYEWMNGLWWYEGVGFTWFGRLETAPTDTAGIEISFDEIPLRAAKRILYTIGLPVYPGMTVDGLGDVLGPRHATRIFTGDRVTHIFRLGGEDTYEISCTVHQDKGLIHLSIIRNDVRRRLAVSR